MKQLILGAAAALGLTALSLSACGTSQKSPSKQEQDVQEPATRTLLSVGAVAPDFTTPAHDGTTITMSALRGQPVVLYFYPKDETPG